MAVLSRFPITLSREVQLPDGNEPRVALAVDVRLPDGRPLTIVNVHFDWVRDDGFRFAQAQKLTEALKPRVIDEKLASDHRPLLGVLTLR